MRTRRAGQGRKGNVLVLTAFMMIAMFALVACAVDLGYLQVARAELQRSADAAAIAATWELIDEDALRGYSYPSHLAQNARTKAAQYAALNEVAREGPGLSEDDVLVTGKGTSKRVMIQAANVLTLGGIPATEGRPGHFIYSPVWLVR